jgi:RecB family exonuclease
MTTMDIHVTDRSAFKECRRKWDYSTVQRLMEKGETIGSPLWTGLSIHHALARYYQDGVIPTEAWPEYEGTDKADLPTRELCLGMLDGYYAKAQASDLGWKVEMVEQEFTVKVPGTHHRLIATIDLLIKKGNEYWVVDHKTAKDLPSEKALELNDQMTAYLWVLRQELGITARGCIYNVLKKKLPTVPPLLKDGKKLSKNMALDVSYESYLDAIKAHDFNPADYADILEHLKVRPDPFFQRYAVCRNAAELDAFGYWLPFELREMGVKPSAKSRLAMYPNQGMTCSWCEFRLLCKCTNEGGDVNYMLETLYQKKPEGMR